MRNIFLVVSYIGTNYNGFQIQPNRVTVQGKLQEAIHMLTGETVKVEGSGRTDAGVHARGQTVTFRTESRIPIERWALALNARLPADIVVREAKEAPLDFHARRSAKRKTYRYTIENTRIPDVFYRHIRYHHPRPLNLKAMEEALPHFLGEHDFTSFCSKSSAKRSHVRTIYDIRLEREGPSDSADGRHGVLHLYVTGNGFLYHMVRIIAGTLIEIGEGKRLPSDIPRIRAARDRLAAGPTAEAHGLMLWEVEYDSD
jgi:tRNA pseudouridine38-40 synthase